MSSDTVKEMKQIRNAVYTQLPIDVAKRLDLTVGKLVHENYGLRGSRDFLESELDTICKSIANYCIVNNIEVDGGDEVWWFINEFNSND